MGMKLPGRDEIQETRRQLTKLELEFMDSKEFNADAAHAALDEVNVQAAALRTVIEENANGHHS